MSGPVEREQAALAGCTRGVSDREGHHVRERQDGSRAELISGVDEWATEQVMNKLIKNEIVYKTEELKESRVQQDGMFIW